MVRLQLATVERDLLRHEGFNPLTWPGGYLLLDRPALNALITLLAGLHLPAAAVAEPPFTLLTPHDVGAFGLAAHRFEGHRQSFHLQTSAPADTAARPAALVLSAAKPLPAVFLYISFVRPVPGDYAEPEPAVIELDAAGLTYLQEALTAELTHLAGE
jgi:hypothetical protein